MGGDTFVEAPEPVNPAVVGAESLDTQLRLAPRVYEAESTYRPLYARLDQQILSDSLTGANGAPGMLDLYGQASRSLSGLQTEANTAQRTADIADVRALAPQATAAFREANPELARLTGTLNRDATRSLSGFDAAAYLRANPDVAAAGVDPLEHWQNNGRFEGRGGANPSWVSDPRTEGGTWAPTDDTFDGQMQAARATGPAAMQAARAGGSRLMPQIEQDAAGGLNRRTAIQAELERQAMEELASGGRLSAEGQRLAQQSARAAAADRGTLFNNSAMLDEVMNAEALREQRLARARQFAATTDAAGFGQTVGNRDYALGVTDRGNSLSTFNAGLEQQARGTNFAAAGDMERFNAGLEQQARGTNFATAADLSRYNANNRNAASQFNLGLGEQRVAGNRAYGSSLAGLLQSQAQDPYQLVLGRSGAPSGAPAAVGSAGYTQQSGARLFDPFNSSIMSMYSGNQANQLAANTATANNRAATNSAATGATATLAAAALLAFACRVARSIYGEQAREWRVFRVWLLTQGSPRLVARYLLKGAAIAAWLRHRPGYAARVRRWMDAQIALVRAGWEEVPHAAA